jgi:hypothetical protein
MVRKPIKKRAAVREAPSAFQKIKDLVERNYIEEPRPDPFEITAPLGKAYQWASLHPDSTHELETYKRSGWKPVRASRHPDFPSEKGKIIFGNSILLEMPRKKYDDLVKADVDRAFQQMREQRDILGMDKDNIRSAIGRIMPESFVVSKPYESAESGFLDLQVNITMRIPWRWKDAAAALQLTPQEYTRRRLIMYGQGHETGLLVPIAPPPSGWSNEVVPFEFIENANLLIVRK